LSRYLFLPISRAALSFAAIAMALATSETGASNAAETAIEEKIAEEKSVEPFNGKDLSGWVVEGTASFDKEGKKQPNWFAEDGEIRCAGKGFGFLRYDKEFADFRFTLEYKLAKRGNSGVGIRGVKYTGKAETRPSFASYELQILDDGGKEPNDHATMSLYRYVAPKSMPSKKAGEWNQLEIECRGPKIRVTLNGEVVQDVDQSTIETIKDKPLSGYLSLQCHGSVVAFRKLKVVELKAE
jgi:hypothetical protein